MHKPLSSAGPIGGGGAASAAGGCVPVAAIRRDPAITGEFATRLQHLPAVVAAPVAALDLGTNNCRLLVARPAGGGFRVIDAFSRIVRLGEGLAATGVAVRGGDRAHARCAQDLRRQDRLSPHRQRALCRHRSLPPRGELRGVSRPRARRNRDRDRDHLDRRGGAARRLRLCPAAQSAHPLRDRVRHRRRLDRDRLGAARPADAIAAGGARRSWARSRCRWASSP